MTDAPAIRPYMETDAADCLAAMQRAIAALAARDYAPDQIAAWLARLENPAWMHGRLTGAYTTLVATDADDKAVGFTNLAQTGHVNMLFLDPAHGGKGLGAALLAAIEMMAAERGIPRLFAEVSHTARPTFLKAGYAEVSRRLIHLGEIGIANTAMEKALLPDAPPPERTAEGLIAEWLTRYHAGDAMGLARLYHHDAQLQRQGHEPVRGREAIRKTYEQEFQRSSPQPKAAIRQAGKAVLLHWVGLTKASEFRIESSLISAQIDLQGTDQAGLSPAM